MCAAQSAVNIQATSSATITATEETGGNPREAPTLRLRCHKPKTEKKVQWTEATVDNEGMDKKKSKCCCVYVKPRAFGESSSESEDECEHCYGHVEMKHRHKHPGPQDGTPQPTHPDPDKPGPA